MNFAKQSFFISSYICVSVLLFSAVAYLSTDYAAILTLAALIAVLPFLVFLVILFTVSTPRSSANLPWLLVLPSFSVLVIILYMVFKTKQINELHHWYHAMIAFTALVGNVVYVFWYSRFPTSNAQQVLEIGKPLPDFTVYTLFGEALHASHIRKQNSLLLFYRGNWCPICTAQIKELALYYQELASRQINVYMVSPQSNAKAAKIAQKFKAPMLFLEDKDNAAAKKLGIDVENGLPFGMQVLGYDSDTVMPTVVMTDNHGDVFFARITDNYRVRPLPQDFLQAFDEHMEQPMSRMSKIFT